MAHENTIYELMKELVIADKHIIGDLMAHRSLWTKGVSAVNNSYKALNLLVDSGKLVKGEGYFKLPDCKSEYKEHSQLLTKALAEIIKLNCQIKIAREHTILEKALRPDSLIFLRRGSEGLCFVLEVCNNETSTYLESKIHTWRLWPEAKDYLSRLFNNKILHYDIVVSGEEIPDGAFEFNSYLEEVKK